MNDKDNRTVTRSLLWAALEVSASFAAGIVATLGIARLIGPSAFGLGSIALSIMLILFSLAGSVVHDVVVQRPKLQEHELDTAFTFSLLVAAVSSVAAALASPLLARILEEPRLTEVFLGLVPCILISGLLGPLTAERRRQLDFRGLAQAQIPSRIAGAIGGLACAFTGAGVWSIVVQQLVTNGLLTVLLLFSANRKPHLSFSRSFITSTVLFTRYVLAREMIIQMAERLFVVVIGRVIGLEAAGHWAIASRLTETIVGITSTTTYHVGLAHSARLQHDPKVLAEALGLGTQWLVLLVLPPLAVLASIGGPVLAMLLGQEWLGGGPLLRILALGAFLQARRLLLIVAVTALGRPDLSFRAVLGELAASLIGLVAAVPIGLVAFAAVRAASIGIGYLIVARGCARELERPMVYELAGLTVGFAALAMSVAAGLALFALGFNTVHSEIGGILLRAFLVAAVCASTLLGLQPAFAQGLFRRLGKIFCKLW